jgi:hypothetical protein|tara:strand:+ start:5362 stop:7155 length:1794 start_codon:yes stop_codon:yes gene_type:complete
MSSTEKITMFRAITDTQNPYYITVEDALKRIIEGKSQTVISQVREGQSSLKKQLPVALFSGVFSGRRDEDIIGHSGLIVLDFDHVNVNDYKSLLGTDEFIRACWISPSGDGLKALVKISNPERHRDHFRALQSYFERTYGLEVDPSGVNESRACFESHDTELISRESSKVFGNMLSENSQHQEVTKRESYTDYDKIDIIARMIRKADDGTKHITLLRAAILCGGYIVAGRMEEDEAVRVLVRELQRRNDVDDMELAKRTIADGIAEGKRLPIREVIDDENRIKREMLILDGDMSFISSDDKDQAWIEKFARGEIAQGLTTGMPELDRYYLFKKEFTIINGHSNVGKTTLALYLMVVSALLHGWRWIIYSSENKTAAVKMRLMEFLVDVPISSMHYEERVAAFKWVNKHFTVVSNEEVYSYTDLIVFAEKLLRQEKYDGFLIDPYNALKITMSKGSQLSSHEYHYEAASELLTFSNSKNMALWVNTHAITEAVRRKGIDGLPIAPFAEDTEGGGKFMNRADSFLTFHRKVQSPEHEVRTRMEIHVRKVRSQETGGQPSPFDDPILLQMNSTRTGFTGVATGNKSFKPMSLNTKLLELN